MGRLMVAPCNVASAVLLSADDGTAPFRTSAEIVNHPAKALASIRAQVRRDMRDVMRGAFPEPSLNAMCNRASRDTGEPPSTFYRLFKGEIDKQDFPLLVVLAGLYHHRTGRLPGYMRMAMA